MHYLYSFLLYLCVDYFCYDNHNVPLNYTLNSGIIGDKDHQLIYKYKNICSYCNKKWKNSSIGDAASYTRFFYFSRESHQNHTEIIPRNMSSFTESGFDMTKDTKLLIHGWLDSAFIHFPAQTRDAYLSLEDVNIIAVDWSPVSHRFYPIARVAVDPVGRYVAQFLDWLILEVGVSLATVHTVGHSLGAQIAGVVGEHVTCGTLSRITGLDPAGPGFDSEQNGRLDSSDAQFVDVIHTAGGWAGYYDSCGHVDFYPNGGFPNQPGCPIDWGKCSHIRSYKLFVESISSDGFIAKACDGWWDYREGECDNSNTAVMGEHVDLSAKGKFYLRTAGSFPYALGNNTNTTTNAM